MSDVKIVESPDAWPGNGPPWLFEDSTPEEIATMQQMASDAAAALEARQSANIEAQTPTGINQVDPETSERIPNGFRATSRESVTTSTHPHRGDVVLFPLQVLSGPNKKGQYELSFRDEHLSAWLTLTTTLPNDAQIMPHVEEDVVVDDE
jgi:hypothetical protein